MRYSIISIDESRGHYKMATRNKVSSWDEVPIKCVDGRIKEELDIAQTIWPYPINYDARVGQLGVWYSVLNAMNHAPIVTFEDDAMLCNFFTTYFKLRLRELPEDADFFSLFIPRDSDHMYNESFAVSQHLCRAYQRYGGVSMYYTDQGRYRIQALLERDGITGQYDDTLYAYSKAGELNGYTSKPSTLDLVYITGKEQSIVQETDFAKNNSVDTNAR